jgi:hypothetical protein
MVSTQGFPFLFLQERLNIGRLTLTLKFRFSGGLTLSKRVLYLVSVREICDVEVCQGAVAIVLLNHRYDLVQSS